MHQNNNQLGSRIRVVTAYDQAPNRNESRIAESMELVNSEVASLKSCS